MKTAYLYIRVSTDEQKRKGYSLPEQEDRLRKYCEYNDIEIKGIFSEDYSAKNFNRPEWKRLIAAIKGNRSKQNNNILFVKWDRFSRNIEYAYEMIGILRKYCTTAMAIDQPIDFTVPESTVMLAVYLSIPEAENERRGLNTSNGIRRAKQMGRYAGKAPLGYANLTGLDGRKYMTPKQPDADLIKWAFRQISKNIYRVEDVRKMMDAKGLRTSKNNFWKLIRNPVYCGFIRFRSELGETTLVKGIHDALISQRLYDEVQDIINTKKRIFSHRVEIDELFPLKRYLICPRCGRKLCGSSSKGRNKIYPYYHCSSRCGTRFKADILNENYDTKLQQFNLANNAIELFSLILNDVNIATRRNSYLNERKILLKNLDEHEAFISKARKLFVSDALRYDDYSAIKKEHQASTGVIKEELRMVVKKLKSIDEQCVFADRSLTDIFEGFSDLDLADKKYIINLFQPTAINLINGDFSITPNKTLTKIVKSKGSSNI